MDSMDVNEITKVIDGVYKNITDNFNPASKQMIATGKAYLKSLHGASAACSMYLDALTKLSKQAQQSSVGTSGDIGCSMMQIADVFKEIHTQQLTTLKAFYVDFLVPLETNLDKDVKVIQSEQKKFLVSHKHRVEAYNKAVSNAKKVRKKSKKTSNPSSNTLDKEIRIMQSMEEERSKLEAFCEEALKEALTQERRRYGFILERQASMAKHYLAFYSKGGSSLGQKLDQWLKVSKTRETLPESMQTNLVKKIQQQGDDECIYCSPRRPADDTSSISSQLRKTKSMEAGEMLNIQNSTSSTSSSGVNYHLTATSSRTVGNMSHLQLQHQDLPITSGTLSRAKSDTSLGMINGGYNESYHQHQLHHQHPQLPQHHNPVVVTQSVSPPDQNFRPKSMAIMNNNVVSNSQQAAVEPAHAGYAKALFAYLSNGDNQLCFLEGDMIAMIGERNRGWQFGENLRTQKMGWFPVAYTEPLEQIQAQHGMKSDNLGMMKQPGPSPVPPPMPPPIPNVNSINGGGIQRTPEGNGNKVMGGGKGAKANLLIPSGRASDSLHSSNDSGFSNDVGHPHHHSAHPNGHPGPVAPPPQPEIDYSDEEPQHLSSEEIKSGNKWLMDRYHMSESARITSSTRRRSLSSGNLSTSDREQQEGASSILRNNNLRNSTYLHNGAGNSPRGPHHLAPATHFYDESKEGAGPGALKKFLSRTKSLIWRRPSNAGDASNQQYQPSGHDSIRLTRPQQALESISCADTTSELWGSHSSIVEMSEFEMKDMGPSSRMGTLKKEEMPVEDLNITRDSNDSGSGDQDYYANGHMKKSGSRGVNKPNREEQNGPTLPPRNEGNRNVAPNKMQLSPGSSSTNSNMSAPLPKEADNSCLVISDHTRSKKHSAPLDYVEPPNYRVPLKEQEQSRRSKNRSSYHNHRQEEEQPMSRSATREKISSNSAQNSKVNRVESFAVSEAPIIPESSSKFSRRNLASGSVALSNKTSRSRVTTASTGKHEEIRGRRRLWDNQANDPDYASDNEDPIEIEIRDEEEEEDDDDDEGTIDFNDNNEYDDEAASSVFMEGEIEPQEQLSKTIMVPLKEAHISNLDGNASKRSKSSDVTIRTTDTRRSRSSSAKVNGMDTVDMPKRHGGFPREKGGRSSHMDSCASRSKSTRSGHALSVRSASSPGKAVSEISAPPPPLPKKEKSSRSTSGTAKSGQSKHRGPMYKGRPIGSPPPIPAPLPQQQQINNVQPHQHPPPPPPPSSHHYPNHQPQPMSPSSPTQTDIQDCSGDLTEVEPDYGTIKGSPSPPRKEQGAVSPSPSPQSPNPQQRHQQMITMKQSIVPYGTKHQSLILRDSEGRKAAPRGGPAWKGSIRSEIHTVELITTDVRSANGDKPVFDYGSFIRRRLYYPERGSRLDQKSVGTGNYCGPWYDLWGEDPSVSVP